MTKEGKGKKQKQKAMKENAICLAATVAGSFIGYTVGGMSALPSGALAVFSKNKYLTAAAAGAMGGGFLAGATEPVSNTGEFGKDLVENAKARGKGVAKGILRGLYVDKVAPNVIDSLNGFDAHHVSESNLADYGAAEEFIRQIEARQAQMEYESLPNSSMNNTVQGVDAYLPQMNGINKYMPTPLD